MSPDNRHHIFRVYPRTGGGNTCARNRPTIVLGLSPHGRGKLLGKPVNFLVNGSIPARAGETIRVNVYRDIFRVYPRTGGGNTLSRAGSFAPMGLSPHGRGKRG